MQSSKASLFARDDTFLGVCEGLGEEFGFNPLPLRVALGIALLWNPVAVLGGYLAVGLALAIARWFYPMRDGGVVRPAVAGAGRPALASGNDDVSVELPAAA